MEWPITEIARLTGVTSRTLRHYAQLGLVSPSRVGQNGYRYYDDRALLRLQRVLLLRELGLGLPAIAEVLERRTDESEALQRHLEWLGAEQRRLERQIASVRSTIDTMERKDQLMAEDMFDGFDHTAHRAEVEERWGRDARESGDTWWNAKTAEERRGWQERAASLAADWQRAATSGVDAAGDEGQRLARRQHDWLLGVPGTPREASGALSADYLRGLGELYVADARFAANYGGAEGARFVRDALAAYASRNLA